MKIFKEVKKVKEVKKAIVRHSHSHFTLGVVNVGGGECRGGECRTIEKSQRSEIVTEVKIVKEVKLSLK